MTSLFLELLLAAILEKGMSRLIWNTLDYSVDPFLEDKVIIATVLASEQAPSEDRKKIGEQSERMNMKLKNLESIAFRASFVLIGRLFTGYNGVCFISAFGALATKL